MSATLRILSALSFYLLCILQAGPAWAITADAPFDDRVLHWENALDAAEDAISNQKITRALLVPVAESVRVTRESARLTLKESEKELDRQRNLYKALGEPPEEGTPEELADVKTRRSEIAAGVSFFDSMSKQCKLVIARADNLLAEIADKKKNLVEDKLFEATPFPLAPGFLITALSQIPAQVDRLTSGVWTRNASALPANFRTMAIVSLLALAMSWVIFGSWISRVVRKHYGWKKIPEPDRNRKFMAAISETAGQIALPAVYIIFSAWIVWRGLGFEFRNNSLIWEIILIVLDFVLTVGFAKVALVPRFPPYRISHFTDSAAKTLSRSIYLLATTSLVIELVMMLGIGKVFSSLEIPDIGTIGAPDELTYLTTVIAVVIISILAIRVLRNNNWRFKSDDDALQAERPLSPMYQTIFHIARILMILSIVLCLSGYLNLGLFIHTRTIWLLGVIAMVRLIHGTMLVLLTEATTADNRFGIHVCQLLGLSDRDHSRGVFWTTVLFDVFLIAFFIPVALMLLGVPWDDLRPAIVSLGGDFTIGEKTYSLLGIGSAIVLLVILFIGFRLFQRFISNRLLVQTNLDVGVRNAISSGIGYLGIGILILFALSLMGLKSSEVALIFGALSVGIGFGLQHIINNFISGLVLLIQRPIKPGDWVVVGQNQGYVKQVNVITTEIETFDNASLIVPNGDLVSSQVINWMHKSRLGRVIIPVGVSYDSDPAQVTEILHQCARENKYVLSSPSPTVVFKDFGDSALLFELRFHIRDMDNYWVASSGVRSRVKSEFDKAGIEIPFPQRVVKVRGGSNRESTTDIAQAQD